MKRNFLLLFLCTIHPAAGMKKMAKEFACFLQNFGIKNNYGDVEKKNAQQKRSSVTIASVTQEPLGEEPAPSSSESIRQLPSRSSSPNPTQSPRPAVQDNLLKGICKKLQ